MSSSALLAPAGAANEIANKRYVSAAFVKASDDNGQKVYSFKFTSASVDRDGEIITLDGWHFDDYLRNPVILDSHDYYGGIEAIVGRCIAIRRLEDAWECDIVFSESPKGKLAQQLVDEGNLRAVSVGFKPKAIKREPNQPPVHTEKELLEISVVPIPSNRDATRTRSATALLAAPIKFAAGGKDFNSCLAQSTLDEDRWRFYHALSEALREIIEDKDLTPEAKLAAANANLAQFHAALLAMIGQAIGSAEYGPQTETLTPEPPKSAGAIETKAGRTLSAKNEALLKTCRDEMKAAHDKLDGLLATLAELPAEEPKSGEAEQTAEVTPPEAKTPEAIATPEPPPAEGEAPDTNLPDEGAGEGQEPLTLSLDPGMFASLRAFAKGEKAS